MTTAVQGPGGLASPRQARESEANPCPATGPAPARAHTLAPPRAGSALATRPRGSPRHTLHLKITTKTGHVHGGKKVCASSNFPFFPALARPRASPRARAPAAPGLAGPRVPGRPVPRGRRGRPAARQYAPSTNMADAPHHNKARPGPARPRRALPAPRPGPLTCVMPRSHNARARGRQDGQEGRK